MTIETWTELDMARESAHDAYLTLMRVLDEGRDPAPYVVALNDARRYATKLGAPDWRGMGNVSIVDGKPFVPSTIGIVRAAEIMANAARRNAAHAHTGFELGAL